MHNLIFRSRGRSYRELPLRLFEFGTRLPLREVRRRARPDPRARHDPGRLALLRAPREQAPDEIKHLLDFVPRPAPRLRARRLLPRAVDPRRPKPDKFVGSDEEWEVATEVLARRSPPSPASSWSPTRAARRSTDRRSRCRRATRSAAPGRCRPSSTTSTSPRGFELEYVAADGSRQRPVMIHSAQVRLDRAVLRGAGRALRRRLPALARAGAGRRRSRSPSGTRTTCDDVAAQLRRSGLRVEVDSSDDRMQKKIRNAQLQKVPFMLIAGRRPDVEAGAVSFRYRDGEQDNGVPVDEAIARVRRGGAPTACRSEAGEPRDRTTDAPPGRAWGARRARAAVDPAPDGLHLGARTSRPTATADDLPVLPDPGRWATRTG